MQLIHKNNIFRFLTLGVFAFSLLHAKDPGINAFYKGDYKKAGDYYAGRLNKDKENEKIMYNSGTTALAQKEYEKANSLLMQSLASENDAQLAKAHYNLGQLAVQQEKMEDALEHFKKSMIYDPNDLNSKIMYEYLRRQQEQQQQEQQDQGQDQEKNQDQEKKQDQQKQDKQDQQDQEQKDQPQDEQQEQEQENQQQQVESQLSEEDLQAQELTKEQAKNILNAMKEEEKESMKKLILSKAKGKKIKRSKEW
ncbi:MAG: tetratricopeptide repeat protein [Candidatus Marinimicrobia bacterium]|nr:tetratricopeptide repeat protein [Candidatus Neomarinimicrobiota bacterium]